MIKLRFIFSLGIILILTISSCNLARGTPPDDSGAQPTGDPVADQQTLVALAVQQTQTAAAPVVPEFTFTPSLTSTITLTTTPEVPRVTVSQSTNCRTGPGEPYDIVGVLPVGTPAEIIGKNASGDTWIIKLPSNPAVTCWLWGYHGTVEGNTSTLAIYTPPATPTPAANFSIAYQDLHYCTDRYGFIFRLVNTGSITWSSYRLNILDQANSYSTMYQYDIFLAYSGCGPPVSEDMDLEPGEEGMAGNWGMSLLDYEPTGHTITATFTLCSENGMAGTCLDKSITFTP